MHGLRIVLLEHCRTLRVGLTGLLASQDCVDAVSAVDSIEEAGISIRTVSPSVVLVDIDAPNPGAPTTIDASSAGGWNTPIVFLTSTGDEASVRTSMRTGASGYVLKDSHFSELIAALCAASAGNRFVCAALARTVLSGAGDVQEEAAREIKHLITHREREVLMRIALGQSNKLSARDLGLSVKTVEKHRSNLMRKLNLHNTAAVTMFALRHGLVNHEDAPLN